ncbi:MAG: TIGR03118 family protein, partial [Pseudonocardiaceae bacterium]
FGTMGGKVLVGNFGGAGRIAAFDDGTGDFVDYLRDKAGAPVGIDGLWNILFGNGESLGEANALYFAAGPAEEKDGLFGALRLTC